MEYITRDGVSIQVGRVNRNDLDNIAIQEPAPPMRSVETWGGIFEDVPIWDDPDYQRALFAYNVKLFGAQLLVIAQGLTFTLNEKAQRRVDALKAIKPHQTEKILYLRYCLEDDTRARLLEGVLYLSTVTQRGIDEAVRRLNYTWRGTALQAWATGTIKASRGKLGVEMQAAIRSHIAWPDFCKLSGPDQSLYVAFWLLEEKLNYLIGAA